MKKLFNISALLINLAIIMNGCGSEAKKRPPMNLGSPSENAFKNSANTYKIPFRLLVAISYVESHINPLPSNSVYYHNYIGPEKNQTAFGLARGTLDISENEVGNELTTQIEAYAKYVSKSIPQGLNYQFNKEEDKFNWIWNLSAIHRNTEATRSIFALEIIETLNNGFTWIDPVTKEFIKFPPESPQIKISNFRELSQTQLAIGRLTRSSPIRFARRLVLPAQRSYGETQQPRGVKIIHCPFTFSTCIEMQQNINQENKEFYMGAHFIIPNSPEITEQPLQIVNYDEVVPSLDEHGDVVFEKDKVTVMLTGLSGHTQSGKRFPADPTWLSPWQLETMGELTHDICDFLSLQYEDSSAPLSIEECKEISLTGTTFQVQEHNVPYTWGDISDFDYSIFHSYILKPNTFFSNTTFEFPSRKNIFSASEKININLTFGLKVKHIQLERLIRCSNNDRVLWMPVANEDVRSEVNFNFEKQLYDSGPNLDGTHYFRAKVYGEEGNLIGWDVTTIYLEEYEKNSPTMTPSQCY